MRPFWPARCSNSGKKRISSALMALRLKMLSDFARLSVRMVGRTGDKLVLAVALVDEVCVVFWRDAGVLEKYRVYAAQDDAQEYHYAGSFDVGVAGCFLPERALVVESPTGAKTMYIVGS